MKTENNYSQRSTIQHYFFYECKRRLSGFLAILALSVLYLLILLIVRITDQNPVNESFRIRETMATLSTFLCLVAIFLPAYLFSELLSKKNIDFFYSLPMTREAYLGIKLLIGICLQTVYFIVTSLVAFLCLLPMPDLAYGPFFAYCGCVLALSYFLFGYSAFAFTRGKNVLDGFVLLVVYTIFFYFVAACIWEIVWQFDRNAFNGESPMVFLSFEAIDQVTVFWQAKLKDYDQPFPVTPVVFLSVVGTLSYLVMFLTIRREKAESIGDISTGAFSYPVLIPIFLFLFTLSLTIEQWTYNSYFLVMPPIGAILGYFLYRRSFRLSKWDMITVAIVFVAAILLGLAIRAFPAPPIDPDPNGFSL